jgi:hypothetical protein
MHTMFEPMFAPMYLVQYPTFSVHPLTLFLWCGVAQLVARRHAVRHARGSILDSKLQEGFSH